MTSPSVAEARADPRRAGLLPDDVLVGKLFHAARGGRGR
jgi:hypothetical protein